jgi:hypothetical protein
MNCRFFAQQTTRGVQIGFLGGSTNVPNRSLIMLHLARPRRLVWCLVKALRHSMRIVPHTQRSRVKFSKSYETFRQLGCHASGPAV